MSGETESNVSGWTVDTLRVYVERRLEDNSIRYQERFDAQEKAISKSDDASEKRFAGVNEFRQTLTDQASTFIPRLETFALVTSLSDKVIAVENSTQRDIISLRTDLQKLKEDISNSGALATGKSSGISALWGYIVGGVGFVALLLTLADRFSK